jgi:hypothetical protein
MLHRLFLAALVLASAACTVTLDGEGVLVREQRRFTVTGAPDLTLTTFDGSIDVRSWDETAVLVAVEKRGEDEEEAERLEVRATQDGNTIRIEVPAPPVRSRNFGFSQSVSMRVYVPRKLTLRAETADGSIVAEWLDGQITLRSGDGSVRVDRVVGQVTVNTGDGSIRAVNIDGSVDLSSGDGSVDVRGRFTAISVDTGDGGMNVEAEPGSAMSDDWSFTTGDGSITLRVPSDFGAEVDAQSGDGTIVIDGSSGQARANESNGNDGVAVLRTRLAAGGRTIRLRSGDGQIHLVSR